MNKYSKQQSLEKMGRILTDVDDDEWISWFSDYQKLRDDVFVQAEAVLEKIKGES